MENFKPAEKWRQCYNDPGQWLTNTLDRCWSHSMWWCFEADPSTASFHTEGSQCGSLWMTVPLTLSRELDTLLCNSEWPSCCLVFPDSKAIVDGNLKLILGLVWTLILHYSISMPVWEDEGDDDAKKQTPKQRLLGWIQNKIPYLPITNFNQNWQDGKALGALVDSCAPGKCP